MLKVKEETGRGDSKKQSRPNGGSAAFKSNLTFSWLWGGIEEIPIT